jgi:hypothetical protein
MVSQTNPRQQQIDNAKKRHKGASFYLLENERVKLHGQKNCPALLLI